ncbi:carbohydrate sulfotransferase 14 [Hyalella azteca]|uniref:Carbohydrate sulfotransferase n=1 Tax=Hyalella azteca TaxID=294128 RepID=A0A8B7NWT8_HYAAZ|nr:carbohydrate sulfotransferase 14 [Hyalella azteca]
MSGPEFLNASYLRSRADDVWRRCRSRPPPQPELLIRASEMKNVSHQMSSILEMQFFKQLSSSLIFLNNNLTWCPVPKVASSSWARALLGLDPGLAPAKLFLQATLRTLTRPVKPEAVSKAVRSSASFLIVRHPLHRVVSAYRNKLELSYAAHDGEYFYKNYGSLIVNKHREMEDVHLYKQIEAHWDDFSNSFLSVSGSKDNAAQITTRVSFKGANRTNIEQKIFGILKWKQGILDSKKLHEIPKEYLFRDPTFPEFVQYLLATDIEKYDEHWKPIYLYCHVCQVRYKYIISYENLQDEVSAFIKHLKVQGILAQKFCLSNENQSGTSADVVQRYLSLLSAETRRKLKQKYERDFDLFGYT